MGMNRDEKGLSKAVEALGTLMESSNQLSLDQSNSLLMNTNIVENYRLQVMVSLSQNCVDAAINRKESRGTHNRLDYDGRDDGNYLKHSMISSSGKLSWIELMKSAGGNWILAPEE
jgi:fumarate reductase flavoprotein subunit